MAKKPATTESAPLARDARIAQIADRQHGVITTAQLRAAGLSDAAIYKRTRSRRLHRLHRGVYAVGHRRLSFDGRCLAALLACGPRAVVSHHSAATLWGMVGAGAGPVAVTIGTRAGRDRRPGISIHRSETLTAGVVTTRDGIAVTTPARTLRDLRRTGSRERYQQAARRVLDLRLVSAEALGPEPDLTRSELERMFLRLCRRRRLPIPEVNARVGSYEVDFLWRESLLVAETDGFRHHGNRAAFESDRARDAQLQSLGYRVLRFTHRQVQESPEQIARSVRRLIRSGQMRMVDPA